MIIHRKDLYQYSMPPADHSGLNKLYSYVSCISGFNIGFHDGRIIEFPVWSISLRREIF